MRRARRGLTLVELIVVIAVLLLLLMAIALPAFLGYRGGAQDAAAKSAVSVVYKNAKAEWALHGAYPSEGALVAALEGAEPGLAFVTTEAGFDTPDPEGRPNVFVDVVVDPLRPSAGPTVTLCARSSTERVFCLRANEDARLQGQIDS